MSITGTVMMYVRLIFVGSLILLAGTASAGTNGKIMGKIVDFRSEPLPGVAVTISGTRLGTTSDPDGRYFIMQVKPGTHEVRAQLIGYSTVIVQGVRVNIDLTSEVNFKLSEKSLTVESVVVTATRPDIEKDVTSSQTIVDGSRASEMPVSQILDVLGYEPGVAVSENNELTIRGGGPSEVRFQVDGMERVDALTRKAHTKLNQVLVSEVTVLTGGFNAEYGNVRSGMIPRS
jgi:carboxypeptidase-like protein/TonB-dependent receptor-like protein